VIMRYPGDDTIGIIRFRPLLSSTRRSVQVAAPVVCYAEGVTEEAY
jgi:hypothetical protein